MDIAYVCSPLRGDMERNQANARKYSKFVFDMGYIPIAPHILFTQFLDDDIPEERRAAVEMDLELLHRAVVIMVFGEPSEGMQEEIDFAHEHNIPIRRFDSEMNELDK